MNIYVYEKGHAFVTCSVCGRYIKKLYIRFEGDNLNTKYVCEDCFDDSYANFNKARNANKRASAFKDLATAKDYISDLNSEFLQIGDNVVSKTLVEIIDIISVLIEKEQIMDVVVNTLYTNQICDSCGESIKNIYVSVENEENQYICCKCFKRIVLIFAEKEKQKAKEKQEKRC